MNIHIEELNNENISIRKNINESEISNECDKCTVLGPVKFSLQQEKKEKLNLTLFNQWHKHLGKFWVFGTRIFNNSQR